MLKIINKNKYEDIIENLISSKIKIDFKNDLFSYNKNYVDTIIIKMTSEDEKEILQGFASIKIYKIKNGFIATINSLWVRPECRGNKYGEILIYHLIKEAKKTYKLYFITAIGNKECSKSLTKNIFEITNPNKVLSNGKIGFIRFSKLINN